MLIFRSIIFIIYFLLYMIYSLPFLVLVNKHDRNKEIAKRDRLVNNMAYSWSKSLIKLTGSKVNVYGLDNLPQDRAVVFISNHQGYFDIPLLLAYIETPKGFIAKKEIEKIPIMRSWMRHLNCVFIQRGNPREALRAILNGIKNVQKGYSMVIFPEGTRSKGNFLNRFKPGSLKLATKSKAPIIPLTIDGTYKIFEESNLLKPAEVNLYIHPPILPEEYEELDPNELTKRIENLIREPLKLDELPEAKKVAK